MIADIAPTYFASIAVLVSAFFGADALKKEIVPVYLADVPVNLIKINLKRNANKDRILGIKKSIDVDGFQKPILLDANLSVILGGTRVEVAILKKVKYLKCIIFTKRYCKKLYRIKSFDELIGVSRLNANEIYRLNIVGKLNTLI